MAQALPRAAGLPRLHGAAGHPHGLPARPGASRLAGRHGHQGGHRLHALRHTAGTRLVRAGFQLQDVFEYLGHGDTS
ncbi:site-specific integrase (plasmid) [Deinococcus wulumuqiensis R12]|nr:site-specific integrase [Deinococcus wulumuqiensis R12]